MSIIRPCLRLATVAALRDRTWCETRVLDSDNSPLAEALMVANAPYIVVYSDDDDRENIEGFDLAGTKRGLLLVIEFAIAGAINPTEGGTTIRIPATDAAFELALDVIETQITNALLHDPTSAWGEMWRELAVNTDKVSSKRGGSAEQGARWAARQLLLLIDTDADPPAGVLVREDHPIRKFIAMARAAPELNIAGAVDIIEAALPTVEAPTWRQAQAWLGLTEGAVRGIGLAPPVEAGPQEWESKIAGLGTAKDGMVDKDGVTVRVGDHEPERGPEIPWPDLEYPNAI